VIVRHNVRRSVSCSALLYVGQHHGLGRWDAHIADESNQDAGAAKFYYGESGGGLGGINGVGEPDGITLDIAF
jgi:hypothetical protein